MKDNFKKKLFLLIADALITLISVSGLYSLTQKPFLPFKVVRKGSFLVVKDIHEQNLISSGDTLLNVDGLKFNNWEEAELYTDSRTIGSTVAVSFLKEGKREKVYVKLIGYYSTTALAVISFVSLLFVFLAIFVALKSNEKSAEIFHWAAMGLVIIITLTTGGYNSLPRALRLFNHLLYLLAFTFTPLIFIRFTLTFTGTNSNFFNKLLKIFYAFALILSIYLFAYYYQSMEKKSLLAIARYVKIYSFVFRPFLIITVLTSLGIFFNAYKHTTDLIQRRKLNWLLLGFLIGPAGFILFWALPIILGGTSLLGEAQMHILLSAVPITFSIAIVKYRLLDINLLLKRSVVYSIVLFGVILAYIFVFTGLTLLIKGSKDIIPAVGAAVIISLFLNPIKNKVQRFVDRKFFRIEYDFRKEQQKYFSELGNSHDIKTLAGKVVEHTNKLIPVEKIGFFIFQGRNKLKLIAQKNLDNLSEKDLLIEKKLNEKLKEPVASEKVVEPGLAVKSSEVAFLNKMDFALSLPLKSSNGNLFGFFAMGRKKSGLPFNKDDFDLLNGAATAISITLEKIQLRQKLIREQLEAERLEELNEMKSLFVSTVSHELKTPLTSIKMFVEMLLNNPELPIQKFHEYLKIIDGESERLQKLIDNILNFTKIEKGLQTYNKVEINVIDAVKETVKSMEYQSEMAGVKLRLTLLRKPITIWADANALKDALINLISNAVKYSPKNSFVDVRVFTNNKFLCISVEDKGIGMDEEETKKIFLPFYRTSSASSGSIKGTGLGLSIVKHIIEAHQGKIEVVSAPGKGSLFTLFFPLEEK